MNPIESTPIFNWAELPVSETENSLMVGNYSVMMKWETPIMAATAKLLQTEKRKDLLEIGFGMGISANFFSKIDFRTHTIIEPHPEIYKSALKWKDSQSRDNIQIINNFWQDLQSKQTYDCIYFDSYSACSETLSKERLDFIQFASLNLLLPKNASLSLFMMTNILEENYQRLLFEHFDRITMDKIKVTIPKSIHIPENTKDEIICFVASR